MSRGVSGQKQHRARYKRHCACGVMCTVTPAYTPSSGYFSLGGEWVEYSQSPRRIQVCFRRGVYADMIWCVEKRYYDGPWYTSWVQFSGGDVMRRHDRLVTDDEAVCVIDGIVKWIRAHCTKHK